MSLDIHLTLDEQTVGCTCSCGHEHEKLEQKQVFSFNITHNLGEMARHAGLYQLLWRPEELNITKAAQLVEPLKIGLDYLKNNKKQLEIFNPANGWGKYENLLECVKKYYEACLEYPEANVRALR